MVRIKKLVCAILFFLIGFQNLEARADQDNEFSLSLPLPGTDINYPTFTFRWSGGTGGYWFYVGTTGVGSRDVFNSGYIKPGSKSKIVTGVPTDTIVYVRAFNETTAGSDSWFVTDYIYNSDNDGDGILDTSDPNPGVNDPIRTFLNPDYKLSILGSGRVASLESDSLFSDTFRSMNRSQAATISKLIYEIFEDEFDFIVVASRQSSAPDNAPYTGGYFFNVQNQVSGIGVDYFSTVENFGSLDRLQGFIHLIIADGLRRGPSLHEFAHNWANKTTAVHTATSAHWGYSNIGGQLGGWQPDSLEALGNNQYQAKNPRTGEIGSWGNNGNGGNSVPFSNFELYLMGLIGPDEVGHDIRIANGFNWVDVSTGLFEATSIDTITMDNVIAIDGPRIPDHFSSQKDFRTLYVVLTDRPLTHAEWLNADIDVYNFGLDGDNQISSYNFWEATDGRASMQLDGLLDVSDSNYQLANSTVPLRQLSGAATSAALSCENYNSVTTMSFSAFEKISVSCSFAVEDAHVGSSGNTYIVIDAGDLGFYQVTSEGNYLPWNQDIDALQAVNQGPLSSSITLEAFNDVKFSSQGIFSADLTIYFAYSVSASGEFIYSANGVPVIVQ